MIRQPLTLSEIPGAPCAADTATRLPPVERVAAPLHAAGIGGGADVAGSMQLHHGAIGALMPMTPEIEARLA